MRKLRKGESYGLLPTIDDTLNTIKRSPLRSDHRDDIAEESLERLPRHSVPRNDDDNGRNVLSNDRSSRRCNTDDDEENSFWELPDHVRLDDQDNCPKNPRNTYLFLRTVRKSVFSAFKRSFKNHEMPVQNPRTGKINVTNNNFLGSILRICCLFFICVLFSDAQAKPARERVVNGQIAVERIKIGDQIPPEFWERAYRIVNHPEGKSRFSFNEIRNRPLIIIDFWSTRCGTCLANLPKQENLKKTFGDSVAFILATNQDAKAGDYLRDHGYTLSSVVEVRETLSKYFPQLFLPMYVWISGDKVVAITQPTEVTEEKLRSYLVNGKAPRRLREDRMEFRIEDPFMADSLIFNPTVFRHSFTLAGYLKNVAAGAQFKPGRHDSPTCFAITNSSVKKIYQSIIALDHPDLRNPNRLVYQTKWKDMIVNTEVDYYYRDSTAHLYSLQYSSFIADKAKLGSQLLAEVNAFFAERYHIVGEVQRMTVPAFVLKKYTDLNKKLVTDQTTTSVPIYRFVDMLDVQSHKSKTLIPWVNQTGEKMELIAVPDILPEGLEDINRFIMPQGYKISKEMVELDMFAIRDLIDNNQKGGTHD
ncbi:TlpA family protein disulfide reductase [Sphingobacterium lumbrici]|uniref:TlpA family protein disulfide reductase n=1 Tax=Sphingobacterium lumbrici TaxID=2559600 RepID=UPI00112786F9|nr:hypothetical protein [Sphingobacterium lumbrici]